MSGILFSDVCVSFNIDLLF